MSGIRHDPAVRYTFETETGELIGRWEPHAPSRDETITVRPGDDVEHIRDELAAGRLPPPPGIRRIPAKDGDWLVFPLPPFPEDEKTAEFDAELDRLAARDSPTGDSKAHTLDHFRQADALVYPRAKDGS